MLTSKHPKKLNRFTRYETVIEMLRSSRLSFRDYSNWSDHNDALFLDAYRKVRKLANLQVLCLTDEGETVHDWSAFANGAEGSCVQFDRVALETHLRSHAPRVRFGPVKHWTIEQLESKIARNELQLDDLPFIKRYPFRCEREFRIILETANGDAPITIEIDRSMVQRVTVSEELSCEEFRIRRTKLRDLPGYDDLEVNQSTLNDNQPWVDALKPFLAKHEAPS